MAQHCASRHEALAHHNAKKKGMGHEDKAASNLFHFRYLGRGFCGLALVSW